MNEDLLKQLGEDDDPALWEAVIAALFVGLSVPPGYAIEIGRGSHWLRPHGSKWAADGGFARPTGYGSGSGGHSRKSLPEFDWSVTLRKGDLGWEATPRESITYRARITIPARSRRHRQAAVHVLWRTGEVTRTQFFGFRLRPDGWRCTAAHPECIIDKSLLPSLEASI